MKWIAAVCLLFATSTMAQCDNNTHIIDIVYPKNSSYFDSQYSSQLDQLTKNTQQNTGYLLLEFKVNQTQSTKEAREYNKWLAQRRIERVKVYLNDAAYPAPVISRLLTASTEKNRSVSVIWCPDESEQGVRVASKNE
ncbi:hypothetical protein L2719_00665 [Shewanella schlegeliana]|uniref:OmpA family protein n=1 Tax=Shewanella schlegeliana TaxID=190308 RepID=A0ABS1SVA0_9GAMM|nr:hypothetical protein [Shewanella schlegeliana]MBL4912457.1 hypothetical protein [Shewanella schlegeliana]MCL1108073.1 hypothetical protein [Shewanella schlegeliana]GIU21681.1 hypothetical protein TUM4433_01320 [Shewanella schlegeliana]